MKKSNSILLVAVIAVFLISCQSNKKKEVNSEDIEVTTEESSGILVTQDNFASAYSNMRMAAIAKSAGGVNTFQIMTRPSSDPAKQFVVRMNRDTPYSGAVIDISEGDAYITVPETNRYASLQIVDENHETQPMIYGPGRHKISGKTDYVFVILRTLDGDIRKDATIEATSSKPFPSKKWDMASFLKWEKVGNETFSKGYDQSKAFGSPESGQTPYMNFVGAAGGWGGAMVQDNVYQTSIYYSNEGCYQTTFANPQDKYFWSATVYNDDGRMFNDIANISSELAPEINKDGSITVRFGCDGQANNIPIREGNTTGKWNVLFRHYGPSQEVLEDRKGYDPTTTITPSE
jgi:hypothetical protein